MDQTFMKEKPVLPLVLRMALPMVISMLVNSLYNIIDSFFVAQVSEDAMTAMRQSPIISERATERRQTQTSTRSIQGSKE